MSCFPKNQHFSPTIRLSYIYGNIWNHFWIYLENSKPNERQFRTHFLDEISNKKNLQTSFLCIIFKSIITITSRRQEIVCRANLTIKSHWLVNFFLIERDSKFLVTSLILTCTSCAAQLTLGDDHREFDFLNRLWTIKLRKKSFDFAHN